MTYNRDLTLFIADWISVFEQIGRTNDDSLITHYRATYWQKELLKNQHHLWRLTSSTT